MFNIDEAVFSFDEIPRLMKQVENSLTLFFINTISKTAKDELEQQLDSVHKSKTPVSKLFYRNNHFNYVFIFLLIDIIFTI